MIISKTQDKFLPDVRVEMRFALPFSILKANKNRILYKMSKTLIK